MEILHKKLILYLILVFIPVIVLSFKTDNKLISFIFIFWIFASPVLATKIFIIDIQYLPFNLQPNRILLILLTLIIFFNKK